MRKLGCVADTAFGNTIEQNMLLVKKAGFDCTFFSWRPDIDTESLMNKANSLELEVETFHSPFGSVNSIWEEGTEGDAYVEVLRRCIKSAGHYGVPCVVMHTTSGNFPPKTSAIGLMRYKKLVIEAEKQNVKLAFENLEFIRHLELVLDYFKGSKNVGFCYDVGHEHCYSPGIRYMHVFGDRLFCTHIHDNLGLAPSKDVDYRDDLHKIPFDGNIDYERVCRDIRESKFSGSLMLEIANYKPHFFYNDITPEQYYQKAYTAAVKLRSLCDGN